MKDKFRVAYFNKSEEICLTDVWAISSQLALVEVEKYSDFQSVIWTKMVIP